LITGYGKASHVHHETDDLEDFSMSEELKTKVETALNKIRPYLQADGGDVQLIDIVDGIVQVRLRGACAGCPGATMTLKMGVERTLREQVPEIKGVEAV